MDAISLQKKINEAQLEMQTRIEHASDLNQIQQIKASALNKESPLKEVLPKMREFSDAQKKELGSLINFWKEWVTQICNEKSQLISKREWDVKLQNDFADIGTKKNNQIHSEWGGLHPVTLVWRELEDLFLQLSFQVLDGPHIEDEKHNFTDLNIPSHHPARDMQDTFWFSDHVHLLRTHTSTVQVRAMKNMKPPFKFIAPGKVFRCERTDATHEMVFHQMEGMMVAENISVAHLNYFMGLILKWIFKDDVKYRLRPGFFPFVEPGFELDIGCLICKGAGCSVCKHSGWVELLPCGMVHPQVLKAGGIDSSQFSGFAFGLGLDRLVMMRYGIDDIRHIHSGDLRFVSQFKYF